MNTILPYRRQPIANQTAALAVFLHGVGGSAADMQPLSKAIQAKVPTLASSVLEGLSPSDISPVGRQWFSIKGITEENREARIKAVIPKLRLLVAHEAAWARVDLSQVYLVGFSQGAIMVLHLIAEGLECAGVLGIAGRLAGPVDRVDAAHDIALLHGKQDSIMPPQIAQQTAQWLADADVPVSLELIDGLGHQIDQRVLDRAITYLMARVAFKVFLIRLASRMTNRPCFNRLHHRARPSPSKYKIFNCVWCQLTNTFIVPDKSLSPSSRLTIAYRPLKDLRLSIGHVQSHTRVLPIGANT